MACYYKFCYLWLLWLTCHHITMNDFGGAYFKVYQRNMYS